jgi:hypothetical protein
MAANHEEHRHLKLAGSRDIRFRGNFREFERRSDVSVLPSHGCGLDPEQYVRRVQLVRSDEEGRA